MRYCIKSPYWYNLIIGIYLIINFLLAIYFIAFPIIVSGPSSTLNSFQTWVAMIAFCLINIIISWSILKGKRHLMILVLLLSSSLWNYWLYSPINWSAPGIKFVILDWTVLVSTIYIFAKGK